MSDPVSAVRFFVASGLWLALLTIGIKVNSAALDPNSLLYWPLFGLTANITNIGAMAMLAAIIASPGSNVSDAAKRGFLVYVFIGAGGVLIFAESILESNPAQYTRTTFGISFAAAAASFDNELWNEVVKKMREFFLGDRV